MEVSTLRWSWSCRFLLLFCCLAQVESFGVPTIQRTQAPRSLWHPTNQYAGAEHYDSDPGWVSIPAEDLTAGERYSFLISAVVPRPVAVVTTQSAEGIVNCAPFSYSSLSSHDPPIVTHGIAMFRGEKKDTLRNIEETGEWVYHVLTKNYLEQANDCASTIKQDETKAYGLETENSTVIDVPRLKDSLVALECKLWDKKEVFNDDGVHTTTIVMGRVVQFHAHSSVLKDPPDDLPEGEQVPLLVDLEKLQAVGRAGDITYWPVGVTDSQVETKPLPRPK